MHQSYFEPFLKDELQRLDKLCGNSVLHKGFSDFWSSLPDSRKRSLLQVNASKIYQQACSDEYACANDQQRQVTVLTEGFCADYGG